MILAVIYDMDGTLVDSERVSQLAWRHTAQRLGRDIPESLTRTFIGRNAVACTKLLEEHFDGDAELARRVLAMHVEDFNQIAKTDLTLKPGARESLAALQQAGLPLALATSTNRDRALERLARFDLVSAFDVIVCGNEVARSKPAPDIFLTAAERLHVAPADCAVVEDSFNGVRAGHAAGMHVFMVPDQLAPTPEIAALCEQVLPTLNELPAALGVVR